MAAHRQGAPCLLLELRNCFGYGTKRRIERTSYRRTTSQWAVERETLSPVSVKSSSPVVFPFNPVGVSRIQSSFAVEDVTSFGSEVPACGLRSRSQTRGRPAAAVLATFRQALERLVPASHREGTARGVTDRPM